MVKPLSARTAVFFGVVIDIDATKAATLTGTDLYIAICVRIGASNGPITVSDIKFVK